MWLAGPGQGAGGEFGGDELVERQGHDVAAQVVFAAEDAQEIIVRQRPHLGQRQGGGAQRLGRRHQRADVGHLVHEVRRAYPFTISFPGMIGLVSCH